MPGGQFTSGEWRPGHAKASKSEALAAWRTAGAKYAELLETYLSEGSTGKIDKDATVQIAKADKRLDV